VAWWAALLAGDLVFYVLLTPLWLGLRVAARWSDRREAARARARTERT
jgi:hypothetical protein